MKSEGSRQGPDPLDVSRAEFVVEARDKRSMPKGDGPEIAVAGRSNVGKSTLLNCIVQRKGLARTSRTPGCTRGVVMFDLTFRNGASMRLVDLPGYGYAVRSKSERRSWGPLIEDYLIQREALRGVLILVDARRGPESEESDLANYLRTIGVPFVLVATKIDKLSRAERGVALDKMSRTHRVKVFGVSGETGEGREPIVRAMLRFITPETTGGGSADSDSGGRTEGSTEGDSGQDPDRAPPVADSPGSPSR